LVIQDTRRELKTNKLKDTLTSKHQVSWECSLNGGNMSCYYVQQCYCVETKFRPFLLLVKNKHQLQDWNWFYTLKIWNSFNV